ncbi:MAG: hypothetical protein LBH64_04245, partial [Coriobacteriales bacterium]|nr:hypothetical protein [Coriobacteriales bacterium]
TKKGIVVEGGGSLTIKTGAIVVGNIYVQAGASLTIESARIDGNIYCAGTLTLAGDLVLNELRNADNLNLGFYNQTPAGYNLSGIYIFNDTTSGVGSLILDTSGSVPRIHAESNGGKIHSFVPYNNSELGASGITDAQANQLFCAKRDLVNNRSTEFRRDYFLWQVVPSSTREEQG